MSQEGSETLSLPSPTRLLSHTHSRFEPDPIILSLSTNVLIARDLTQNSTDLEVRLRKGKFRPESAGFIDQNIVGSQSWNPFGFDQQRDVLFKGTNIVPLSNTTILTISFRADNCFDPRGDEVVTITLDGDFVLADHQLLVVSTGSFVVKEDDAHATRRLAGLLMSVLVTVLLVTAAILGNPGISIIIFSEFQLTNVIGRQSCSRGNIATYFEDAFWVVTPSLKTPSFAFDPHFGVILVHSIVGVAFFLLFVGASRARKKVRLYFPAFPLGCGFLLFIGGSNSAWSSAVHGENPGVGAGSMVLWVIFFLGFGLTVWRIRSPRGLVFLKYNGGVVATLLRGTHSPLHLREKYSIMVDFWHEDHVMFTSPLHIAHLSISSILSAFAWSSTLGCFPVLGVQLSWQAVVFLGSLFARPARSMFHNALLTLHAIIPLATIVAQLLSLDCLGNRSTLSLGFSEALTVAVFVAYIASGVLQVVAAILERSLRLHAEQEAKDIANKHRRIMFFLEQGSGSSAVVAGKLPPIAHHQIIPRLVDPDWRSRRHQETFSFPHLKQTVEGEAWINRPKAITTSQLPLQPEETGAHWSPGSKQHDAARESQGPTMWTTIDVEVPAKREEEIEMEADTIQKNRLAASDVRALPPLTSQVQLGGTPALISSQAHETVSRCPKCRRWMLIQDGCPTCR